MSFVGVRELFDHFLTWRIGPLPARNDSPRLVLREPGSFELERALKQLAPIFMEARRRAKRGMAYVSPHGKRRQKAVRARRRIARHKANVSRSLRVNL